MKTLVSFYIEQNTTYNYNGVWNSTIIEIAPYTEIKGIRESWPLADKRLSNLKKEIFKICREHLQQNGRGYYELEINLSQLAVTEYNLAKKLSKELAEVAKREKEGEKFAKLHHHLDNCHWYS